MGYHLSNKLKIKQVQGLRKLALTASVSIAIVGLAVIILHLKHPERALAAGCESSYTLDWSVPETYTVSCGSVNAANWTVKGMTCFYYSPVFQVGGNIGDPYKEVDISVRINQSGNLDGNDTAWVYMYANNVIVNTYSRLGDISAAVFSVDLTMQVQAGGTYKIVIKLQNDKTNETWQIKNGDVTTCLRAPSPLPITLADFTAKPDPANKINLKWTTHSEVNNDYFTVERSATGVDFMEIGRVKGAGNSSSIKSYFLRDESPFQGMNFYRLKQTDFNGTNTYSTVIKAAIAKTTTRNNNINIYPNPFREKFSVDFEAEADQEVTIRMTTLQGKVLHFENHKVEKGSNNIAIAPPVKMQSGNYVIQVLSHGNVIGSAKAVAN